MLKKILKSLVGTVMAVIFVFAAGNAALAADSVEWDKNDCSIQITPRDVETHKAVTGSTFTLYKVGKAAKSDYNLIYVLENDFKDAGVDITDLQSSDTAKDLAEYAEHNQEKVHSVTKIADKEGTVLFENLPVGLYLIVQNGSVPGYDPVMPFLVSVPMTSEYGTAWIYNVDASPKMETEKKPTPPPPPELPYTGQLNWPIPVMAGIGVALFAFGWGMVFLRKKRHE